MPGTTSPELTKPNKQREKDGLPPISYELYKANLELQRRQVDTAGGLNSTLAGTSASASSPSDSSGAVKDILAETVAGAVPVGSGHGRGRVRFYPDLLNQINRRYKEEHGKDLSPLLRISILLKAIDNGRDGLIPETTIKAELCGAGLDGRFAYKIGTWRGIRQKLDQGADLFWERYRDKHGRKMIRLFSWENVLRALFGNDIEILRGDMVWVPLIDITGSLADFRAIACYEGFLVGRKHPERPISKTAIRNSTGLSERAQWNYRQKRNITAQANQVIIGPYSQELRDKAVMQYGPTVYRVKDWEGKHGKKGAMLLARKIADCYAGMKVEKAEGGVKKSINKAIMIGLSQEDGDSSPVSANRETEPLAPKLYYSDAGQAWNAVSNQKAEIAIYPATPHGGFMPNSRRRMKFSRVNTWGMAALNGAC